MSKRFIYKPVGIARIYLPFLACIAVVIIIQAAIFYQVQKESSLDKEVKETEKKVQIIVSNADFMQKTARTISVQIFFDEDVKDLLYYDVQPSDFGKYMHRLNTYKAIYPYLTSLYIYNGKNYFAMPNYVSKYDKDNFIDERIMELLPKTPDTYLNTFFARKIINPLFRNFPQTSDYVNGYTYIFSDSRNSNGDVTESIVLNFSDEWLSDSLEALTSGGDHVFGIDQDGRLLCNDGEKKFGDDLTSEEYIRQVMAATDETGNFKTKIDGEDFLVCYSSCSIEGWKFVVLTPYSKIIGNLQSVYRVTVFTAILILLFGGLAVFFFSRQLYIPWQYMHLEKNRLEAETRENYLDLRNEFIKSFVSGYTSCEQLLQQKKYDLSLRGDGLYVLFLLRVDSYSAFCSKKNRSERKLIKYAASNILTEMTSACFRCECVDMDDDEIVCLVEYDRQSPPQEDERLQDILKRYIECVVKHLDISFSIVVSTWFSSLAETPEQRKKAFEASFLRFIKGHSSIIFDSDEIAEHKGYPYPTEKEKQICDALMQGHFAEAKTLIHEMLEQFATYGSESMQVFTLRFLITVHNFVELCIESNQIAPRNHSFNESVSAVQSYETLEEMQNYFYLICDNLQKALEEKKDSRHTDVINQVIDEIDKSYADINLSMESLANKVGLSHYYLGKLFKAQQLVSLPVYINNVRLKQACSLLLDTRLSIDEIMQACGFISRSNFYSLFKKSYGITPSQYRNDNPNELKQN